MCFRFWRLVLLWCAFTFAQAPLPKQPLLDLSEGLSHSVSLDLTLGRPWEESSRSEPRVSPFEPSVGTPQGMEDSRTLEAGITSLPKPVPHVRNLRLLSFDTSSTSLTSSPHQPITITPVQELSVVASTAQPDKDFSHLLTDPDTGTMRLPDRLTYIKSPWFTTIFEQMLLEFFKRPLTMPVDARLSDASIWEQMDKRSKFFTQRGRVYKLPVQAGRWGATESREVLLRHHARLLWSNNQEVRTVTAAWATTDEGSSLALLGLYNGLYYPVSEDFFNFFGMQSFKPMRHYSRAEDLFLVPVREADAESAQRH